MESKSSEISSNIESKLENEEIDNTKVDLLGRKIPPDLPPKKKGKKSSDDLIEKVLNNQETLIKKLDNIQKDLNLLKKSIKEPLLFTDENLDIVKDATKLTKLTQEQENKNINFSDTQIIKNLVSILTSQTTKKSISLNIEIEKQISTLLSEYLGDKSIGSSDLVNIGLMIALLK